MPPVVTVPGNIEIGGVTVLNVFILHLILCNFQKFGHMFIIIIISIIIIIIFIFLFLFFTKKPLRI